ncbi:MAG: biotin transporter BioY [Caldisericia bacterium]|jgi:biotin transport system substrate-specific component|nr:biotin transporter BioY [Caldisericia bacterium]
MKNLKFLIFSSLFAILISIGSYIYLPLPFTPVPLTFQLFFVLLSGILLGPFYGFLSILIYIILGIMGLPVFAGGGSGLGYLFGKTGGYLLGFLISPIIVGNLFRLNKKLLILAIFSGIFIVHLLGILYLSKVLSINFFKAFTLGSLPFIPIDIIKGLLTYIVSIILLKNSYIKRLFFIKSF